MTIKWYELYSKKEKPTMQQISNFIQSTLWLDLCEFLEQSYNVVPLIEHSICSGAPGWNVKYKKSGRALCTLYPSQGYFTAMVSIGSRESTETEMLLAFCTDYLNQLYWNTKSFNGGRWLMIEVSTLEVLNDVKQLILIRAKNKEHTV